MRVTIKVLVVDGMVKCLVMKRFFVCDRVQSLQEVNQEVMRLCAVGEGSQMGSTGRVFACDQVKMMIHRFCGNLEFLSPTHGTIANR